MQVTDTRRFVLEGTNRVWLHLGTIQHNLREYMCLANRITKKIYIEEISGGHLEFIWDDSLVLELSNLFREAGCTDMTKPLVPDTRDT
jgi:hypothetical protein